MAAGLQESGTAIEYTPTPTGAAPNMRRHRIMYSGSRKTALSPPAFEQCPVFRGCAPTGPLRPRIGAHLKRPPNLHLSLQRRQGKRLSSLPGGVTAPPRGKGMSRWRALEREQFRALIASPFSQDRPEGGSKSC
jgi:hypothetical protein